MCNFLTCKISSLVNVGEGIIVCEAQFLVKVIPCSCFSEQIMSIISNCITIDLSLKLLIFIQKSMEKKLLSDASLLRKKWSDCKIVQKALTTFCVIGWLSKAWWGRRGTGAQRQSCQRCPRPPRPPLPCCRHPPPCPRPSPLKIMNFGKYKQKYTEHGYQARRDNSMVSFKYVHRMPCFVDVRGMLYKKNKKKFFIYLLNLCTFCGVAKSASNLYLTVKNFEITILYPHE